MPRQDVPYGGAICRLRERIAEIWDNLGEKLHSINGVEGDGQGNVLIRSDSAALTITDDQVQHEIVLDLDTSQLPAADVNSVNGQTGVVALTADDIPSDNGDVQTDLDNLAGADITLQGNINAEALARQNADSTLQTNINAATASIPGEVTTQIANNAQIAFLMAEDSQNIKTTGNQTKAGTLTLLNLLVGRKNKDFTTNASSWTLLFKRTSSRQQWMVGFSGHSMIIANVQSNTKINTRVISNNDRTYTQPILKVATDSNGVTTVWAKPNYSAAMNWYLMSNMLYGTDYTSGIEILNSTGSQPVVGNTTSYDPTATYTDVYDSTDFEYVR